LPLFDATLEPHIGMSIYPAAVSTKPSPVAGFDFVLHPGNDWYAVNKHPRTWRVSFGYEFDPLNTFLINSFKIKFGYNTWHGRIVIPKRLRRGAFSTVKDKKDSGNSGL